MGSGSLKARLLHPMGFGIITQHLSFYKKHNFIQFENSMDEMGFEALQKALKNHKSADIFNKAHPMFIGDIKSWVVDMAKMAIFLSCEKKLRLGGYFTLPYEGIKVKTEAVTLKELCPYNAVEIGAVIPLNTNAGDPEPMSIEKPILDFAPFSSHDLFFVEAGTPFFLPETPVLILPFLKEKVRYAKSVVQPAPISLTQEKIGFGDSLFSQTHPLITV